LYIYTHPEFNSLFDGLGAKFCGRLPSNEFREALKSKDILLYMPECFSETFCITSVEAQLMGMLCIHNGAGALKEVTKYGCMVKDENEAVDCILDYASNPEKYAEIKQKNKQNCIELYSIEGAIDAYEALVAETEKAAEKAAEKATEKAA
jgi:glycosyltransferase involved in cell wall biosynthesis